MLLKHESHSIPKGLGGRVEERNSILFDIVLGVHGAEEDAEVRPQHGSFQTLHSSH